MAFRDRADKFDRFTEIDIPPKIEDLLTKSERNLNNADEISGGVEKGKSKRDKTMSSEGHNEITCNQAQTKSTYADNSKDKEDELNISEID